jgi:hypothetical protein
MASASHLDAVPQATPINRNRVIHKKVRRGLIDWLNWGVKTSHLDAVPQATPINRNRVIHKKVRRGWLIDQATLAFPPSGRQSPDHEQDGEKGLIDWLSGISLPFPLDAHAPGHSQVGERLVGWLNGGVKTSHPDAVPQATVSFTRRCSQWDAKPFPVTPLLVLNNYSWGGD